MFEDLRRSLRELIAAAGSPAERSAIIAQMKSTLVQARVGVADLGAALEKTRNLLAAEEKELATVRRRKAQAESIGDAETVEVATRFEKKHAERVEVLTRKLGAQQDELSMAEAEVAAMMTELKAAAAGVGMHPNPMAAAREEVDNALNEDANLGRDLSALERQQSRAAREAEAEQRLAELKRKLGK
jgi:hypothetical protein